MSSPAAAQPAAAVVATAPPRERRFRLVRQGPELLSSSSSSSEKKAKLEHAAVELDPVIYLTMHTCTGFEIHVIPVRLLPHGLTLEKVKKQFAMPDEPDRDIYERQTLASLGPYSKYEHQYDFQDFFTLHDLLTSIAPSSVNGEFVHTPAENERIVFCAHYFEE